jgi:hypothetical protein
MFFCHNCIDSPHLFHEEIIRFGKETNASGMDIICMATPIHYSYTQKSSVDPELWLVSVIELHAFT